MSNDERREVVAVVRTYFDKEAGKDKNVYVTVGSAWVSEHGSKISLVLDTMPVSPTWNGKLYINKPYEKASDKLSDNSMTDSETPKDIEPTEDDVDKPISLDAIPF